MIQRIVVILHSNIYDLFRLERSVVDERIVDNSYTVIDSPALTNSELNTLLEFTGHPNNHTRMLTIAELIVNHFD